MGYTLVAKNKELGTIDIGAFQWSFILQDTGMGYVLGYGKGLKPTDYVYKSKNNGSPVSNDGYKVTAKESVEMASVCDGFLSVQRFVRKEFDALSKEEQEYMEKSISPGYKTYNIPWATSRLDEIEKISKFIRASKGFKIT